MAELLCVKDLTKVYGKRGAVTRALDGVDLSLEAGEYVGIMGASGSGKTTLLNCISTIDRPTSGSIQVDGEELTGLRGRALTRFRRERLGFIFQDSNLLDTLTAFENIALALSIVGTPSVARIVRSQVLSIKESEHVESARAMGATDLRIMFRYILPLCVSPLIIRFTATMASAILTEASLSFLGVGVDPTMPTWGAILSTAKDFVITHPYMAIYPGLAIVITVLSISILGDGLRDLLDPKMK